MKIEKFEDIIAWQESRKLVKSIFLLTSKSDDFKKDFRFNSQIRSSSISIMANIAEGFSRKSNKEFCQFLFIAKGSAAETQSHLYVAKDIGYIEQVIFSDIYNKAEEVSGQINGFIEYLKTSTFPCHKYK